MAFNNQFYPNYYNPYNNPYNSFQQPQQTFMPQPQQNAQNGQPQLQMVDSFEVAKAKDVDMTGTPRYYPNINGQEIYMKQLQADGTCPTIVYKRAETESPVQKADPSAEAFSRVFAELDAIKSMLTEPIKPRGGSKA